MKFRPQSMSTVYNRQINLQIFWHHAMEHTDEIVWLFQHAVCIILIDQTGWMSSKVLVKRAKQKIESHHKSLQNLKMKNNEKVGKSNTLKKLENLKKQIEKL